MSAIPTISQPPSIPSIFHLIHELHAVVIRSIDSALTWDQLNSPPIQYTLVRPFVSKYAASKSSPGGRAEKQRSVDGSLLGPERGQEDGEKGEGWALGAVLYALMANRIQFINLAEADLSYSAMQNSRAAFCEMLAMKIIRASPHADDEAELVDALVHGWCAFDGASEEVWDSFGDERGDVAETTGSALELAIVSQSKRFLSLPLIQHLISQIYTGHLIYLPTSHRSLISDSYVSDRTKQRRQASHSHSRPPSPRLGGVPLPSTFNEAGSCAGAGAGAGATRQQASGEVFVYNPYEAGWLDHQRLRVPKWRNWIEFANFAVLLGLFIATLASRDINAPTVIEFVSVIFTFGFILDEFAASQEHGWTVYAANAWNAFDLAYIAIFILYLSLRIFALITHSPTTSDLAFDILAIGACILFPRLVFFLIKDHVVIIALKAMVARFLGFMGLTFLAFSGICFCLWTLGRATWTVKQIIWLMLQIWFGSSYLGFSASESFHPIFGPIILISYAALCNVLLITILIAILSNKFAEINGNAQEEHMFQRVVKTVEGVKSDPIFSYMPPLNLVAFFCLSPLSWVCDARTLHRVNVFCVRAANFPILFLISAYERWSYRTSGSLHLKETEEMNGAVESVQRSKMFDSWLGGGSEVLISSVFEVPPPLSALHIDTDLTRSTQASAPLPSESSDSDTDAEHPQHAQNGKNRRKPKAARTRSSGFDSPLARLFGAGTAFGGIGSKAKSRWAGSKSKSKTKSNVASGGESNVIPSDKDAGPYTSSKTSQSGSKDASRSSMSVDRARSSTTDTSDAEAEQVKQLKQELAEVRESQLRMEEMLNRMLNPASGGE